MADKLERPENNEITTSRDGRDITRGWLSALMQAPVDDKVLIEQGGGDYRLYEDILRDDNVRAGINQRIYGVIAKPWEIIPGGKRTIDKTAADFIRAQIDSLEFDKVTLQMLHGTFYGFSIAEAVWDKSGNHIVLADIKVRNRRRFAFDGAGGLRLKTFANMQPGELMPNNKFWVTRFGADHHDAPYGLGLAHYLYWPVWLKRNVTRFWAVYLEKFGTPSAVGKYPPGTQKVEQEKLLSALRSLQRDSATVIPQGMEMELVEAMRSSAADHKQFVEVMNEAILLICLGQMATAKGTSGKLGNDASRENVKDAILKADADLLCESFNRSIVKWLVAWNFPGATPPRVYRVFDDEDLDGHAARDKTISEMGYKPTLKYITEKYGGEWVEANPPADNPDASRTQSEQKDASDQGDKNDHSEPLSQSVGFSDNVNPTPVDPMTDRLDDETTSHWMGMMDHVKNIVDQAQSLQQLRDELLAAYGGMEIAQLTEIMAMGFAAAELTGRFDVNEGDKK